MNFSSFLANFQFRAEVKKVTSRAEPSWKSFSSSYDSSQLGSDSSLMSTDTFALNHSLKVKPFPQLKTRRLIELVDLVYLPDFLVLLLLNLPGTVVHPRYRVGTFKYMTRCHHLVVHVKRLLRVHTVSHKRDYCWKFVVCLQLSILHPKNTKFGKSDVFKSLKIA